MRKTCGIPPQVFQYAFLYFVFDWFNIELNQLKGQSLHGNDRVTGF